MRLRAFDVVGVVAVALFALAFGRDLDEMGWSSRELRPGAAAAPGQLVAGTAWYGVYAGGEKAGWLRVERRPTAAGLSTRTSAELELEVLGAPRTFRAMAVSEVDRWLELERLSLVLESDLLNIEAEGRRVERGLELAVRIADVEQRMVVPATAPGASDSLGARVLAARPEPGERFAIEVFDPFGLAPRTLDVEYLGRATVIALDGRLPAHRLRTVVEGLPLDTWVDDSGEVLRQELPFDLVIVRETEAEAIAPEAAEGGP